MNMAVVVRAAVNADVPAMHRIRLSVRENALADRTQIGEADYLPFVHAGAAWVAEAAGRVVGFAAIDLASASVWALFVDPASEGQGIGSVLHQHLLDWSRDRGLRCLSLTTTPGTRADRFYRRWGWDEVGRTADGELRLKRLP